MKELGEVEQWMTGFYSLLCKEPERDFEGGTYAKDSGQFSEQEPRGTNAVQLCAVGYVQKYHSNCNQSVCVHLY